MDRDRLAELFHQYGDDVYRLAYSYLGSRADAEDICQDVFLKLAGGGTTLLPGKEKAWLLTCTANRCKSHLRSFWRRNVGELDESVPFREESDREVWDAVQRLPAKYRVVVHLCYWEGLDQGETGAVLGLSRSAVQTRMSRARALLKKELSDDEGLQAHDASSHAE